MAKWIIPFRNDDHSDENSQSRTRVVAQAVSLIASMSPTECCAHSSSTFYSKLYLISHRQTTAFIYITPPKFLLGHLFDKREQGIVLKLLAQIANLLTLAYCT